MVKNKNPPKDSHGKYLLPICWLGAAKTVFTKLHGRVIQMFSAYGEEDVNMECTCNSPMKALLCGEGHVAECHKGLSCELAQCSHYQRVRGGSE